MPLLHLPTVLLQMHWSFLCSYEQGTLRHHFHCSSMEFTSHSCRLISLGGRGWIVGSLVITHKFGNFMNINLFPYCNIYVYTHIYKLKTHTEIRYTQPTFPSRMKGHQYVSWVPIYQSLDDLSRRQCKIPAKNRITILI